MSLHLKQTRTVIQCWDRRRRHPRRRNAIRQRGRLVFPIALDLNSTVKRAYRIFGPPATFFIDAQGVIRDMVIGPITPERAREGLKKAGVPL